MVFGLLKAHNIIWAHSGKQDIRPANGRNLHGPDRRLGQLKAHESYGPVPIVSMKGPHGRSGPGTDFCRRAQLWPAEMQPVRGAC